MAERLGAFLGRRLGLYLGVGIARLQYALSRKRRRPMGFVELIGAFLRCAATLAGVACSSLDPDGVRRIVRQLAPLRVLGPQHAATFTYRYCAALECIADGRAAEARAELMHILTELRSSRALKGFTDSGRHLFLGGTLYALGAVESLRDGPEVLKCADALEQLGPSLYGLVADQLRLLYHAQRGETELAQRYRNRVETFAIQRGSAWQVEIWEAPVMVVIQSREGDVVGLKRTMAQLERLAQEIPSLRSYAELARGTYLRLRGQVRQAIDLFEALLCRPDARRFAGYSPAVASLAALYNEIGEHQRAHDLTAALLASLTEEDRQFVRIHLLAQIEHVMATAALGHLTKAADLLEACVEEHEPGGGPVTLGLLHQAGVRLALQSGDDAAYRLHLSEMDRWLRPTRNPTLIAACERLAAASLPVAARGSSPSGSFSAPVEVSTSRR
jgi:tetratricopeptide (TPR) repeat protein